MHRPDDVRGVVRLRLGRLAAVALLTAGLAACGSSGTSATTTTTTMPDTVLRGAGPGEPCHAASPPSVPDEPTVVMPKTAPERLQVTDLVRGHGPPVQLGQTIVVQYVGVACSTGTQFDATWDRGTPLTRMLKQGSVIRGWVDGIPGMRVGGRRRLVIPPAWGYGERGFGKQIRPGETLVVVVDLVSFR